MYISYKNIYSWNPLLSVMLLDLVDQERKQGPRCSLPFSFAVLSKADCLLKFASFKVRKGLPIPYRWPEWAAIFQGSVSHGLCLLKEQRNQKSFPEGPQ